MSPESSGNSKWNTAWLCASRICAKTFADGTQALVSGFTGCCAAARTVVLLGPPQAAAKLLLLRIIAGLGAPDTGGRVPFNRTDVSSAPNERRNVGMVFQS